MKVRKVTKHSNTDYRPFWKVKAWVKGSLEHSKENLLKVCCKLCNKDLVPGKTVLQKHTKTADHIKNTKYKVLLCSLINFVSVISDAKVEAELDIVAMIARDNISLTFPYNYIILRLFLKVFFFLHFGVFLKLLVCRGK